MEYSSKDFYPHGIKGAYREGEKQGYMLGKKVGSKETAEKILNELYVQFSADYLIGLRNEYKDWKYADLIKRYAKQFGVEVE